MKKSRFDLNSPLSRGLPGAAMATLLLGSPIRVASAAPGVHTASSCIEWGKSALRHQRWDEARRYFRNALYIDPRRADAYAYLGDVYLHTGNVTWAREEYQKALRLDPHLSDAERGLHSVMDEGEHAAYVAGLAEQVQKEPGNAAAHASYAEELAETGRDDEAGSEARKALALNPKENHAQCVLGRLAAKAGRDRCWRPPRRATIRMTTPSAHSATSQ
jgi:Tfp pilus assembly protein PilF